MCELREIRGPIISDHHCLSEKDRCFFLGEYTTKKGAKFSEMNQLILNFKKGVDRREKEDWKYKEEAINDIALMFWRAAGHLLKNAVLVPTPPSKSKNDSCYDDRMLRMLDKLKSISIDSKLDIRELVVQSQSYEASHVSETRLKPGQLSENYEIDEGKCMPEPKAIIVFDDTIVAGAHYVAMRGILSRRFPRAKILGFFVARRVFS